ncbi:hypothetical protein KS4_00670 [Poriferisphaera corsica]|uniref:Uncharacterized protein n=1 Tax=Poriferisphaera corsica TaxID=2528020 RepID=A0A517YP95_9BACT|nr:hypothetical protein [Poriferisphaera corsica]QDU32039.1 hypothetical protein KS4_00670 [Poriferisphaera corsica]
MSGNKDDKKINQTLFGVNLLLIIMLVVGMIVYFNIRQQRKSEFEQFRPTDQSVAEQKQSDTQTPQVVSTDKLGKELPSRKANRSGESNASASGSATNADGIHAAAKDSKEEIKMTMAEDIKDIMDQDSNDDQNVIDEMSIDYDNGSDLLSGTDRARLILLETKDMKLVDQLVGQDEQDKKNKSASRSKKSALEQAAENSSGRRPNYGKVRKGLIGVAEALVRLNSRIVEVEPLKEDDEEAVTSLEYGP